MIPKIIHYCWFGGKELPPLAKKCIASWEKFCPGWQIIQWNEDNFDVSRYAYTKYCYEQGKWAFLSDFVRLAVVMELGGVYLDTDVELVKPLDALLEYEAFYGFENESVVNTGHGFGAVPEQETVEVLLAEYLDLQPGENGDYALIACPRHNTRGLKKLGLVKNGQRQTVAGAEILPEDWLNPYEYVTGTMNKTENTVAIHWYNQSWVPQRDKLRAKLTKPFHKLFGKNCFDWMKKK